jgi:hypothetical protein
MKQIENRRIRVRNFNRNIVLCVLSLIAGISTFLVPSVSYAHPLPLQPKSKPFITTYVMSHGNKQTFKVDFGQEVVIPTKNGSSIHFKTDFTPVNNKGTISRYALTPKNGSVPIFECGYATGQAAYVDSVHITVMTYHISDYFCNNGIAVTTQLPPSDGGGGIPGVSLSSHSTYKGWIQKPAIAYAVGNYTFTVGIATPWITIGENCVGSIQMNLYGDGPFTDYNTNC